MQMMIGTSEPLDLLEFFRHDADTFKEILLIQQLYLAYVKKQPAKWLSNTYSIREEFYGR